jgi:hypothetical protein
LSGEHGEESVGAEHQGAGLWIADQECSAAVGADDGQLLVVGADLDASAADWTSLSEVCGHGYFLVLFLKIA